MCHDLNLTKAGGGLIVFRCEEVEIQLSIVTIFLALIQYFEKHQYFDTTFSNTGIKMTILKNSKVSESSRRNSY